MKTGRARIRDVRALTVPAIAAELGSTEGGALKVGVLGTGMVGRAIGTKLVTLGHEVTMGSRSGTHEKAEAWAKQAGGRASHGTFADAAAHGETIFNCTSGTGAVEASKAAGAENLRDKVRVDISNPLDFSKGMPPPSSFRRRLAG